jgi:hypothetical protein
MSLNAFTAAGRPAFAWPRREVELAERLLHDLLLDAGVARGLAHHLQLLDGDADPLRRRLERRREFERALRIFVEGRDAERDADRSRRLLQPLGDLASAAELVARAARAGFEARRLHAEQDSQLPN